MTMDEPPKELGDTKQLILGHLDRYRAVVAAKLDGLPDADLQQSRLPSGWTPAELLKHLVYMEQRWFVWGFAAEQVPDPWGDNAYDDRRAGWWFRPDDSVAALLDRLRRGGERTRQIVEAAELTDRAATGGRFGADNPPPTLNWICFHVLQEYARHAGHLDIVRELTDGAVGE
jgi:hypothetical protein